MLYNGEEVGPRQRRRALLLRMMFIFWMLMLILEEEQNTSRSSPDRRAALRGSNGLASPPSSPTQQDLERAQFERERSSRIGLLNKTIVSLSNQNADKHLYPANVSAVFRGDWARFVQQSAESSDVTVVEDQRKLGPVPGSGTQVITAFSAVELNANFTPPAQSLEIGHDQGSTRLALHSRRTKVHGVHYVFGKFDLNDGYVRSQKDILTHVSGFYIESVGQLSLFFQSGFKSSHVALEIADLNPLVDGTAESGTLEQQDVKARLRTEMKEFLTESKAKNTSVALLHQEAKSFPRVWDSDIVELKKREPQYTYNMYRQHQPCFFRIDLQADRYETIQKGTEETNGDTMKEMENGEQKGLGIRIAQFRGKAVSENCGVEIQLNVSAPDIDLDLVLSKAQRYAWLETLLTTCQIISLVLQVNYCSTQTRMAKVSPISIGMIALTNGMFATFLSVGGLLQDRLFGAFIMTTFTKLLLFSVFDLRYLLLIWKARHPQDFSENFDSMQRFQAMITTPFYVTLSILAIVAWHFAGIRKLLWFILYSFWIPQIVSNVLRETSDPLHMYFLLFGSASRLVAPLYIYGCPVNFLTGLIDQGESLYDPWFCVALVMWMALQVGLLLVQRQFGPHVLIPARFLPKKYDYNRKIPEALRGTDCAICMLPVNGVDIEHMITPCNHLYHRDCLLQWTSQKMICPQCRADLPSTAH